MSSSHPRYWPTLSRPAQHENLVKYNRKQVREMKNRWNMRWKSTTEWALAHQGGAGLGGVRTKLSPSNSSPQGTYGCRGWGRKHWRMCGEDALELTGVGVEVLLGGEGEARGNLGHFSLSSIGT